MAAIEKMSKEEVRRRVEGLTDRQRKVIQLLCKGASNPEIAAQLNVDDESVKKYNQAIYAKFEFDPEITRNDRKVMALLKDYVEDINEGVINNIPSPPQPFTNRLWRWIRQPRTLTAIGLVILGLIIAGFIFVILPGPTGGNIVSQAPATPTATSTSTPTTRPTPIPPLPTPIPATPTQLPPAAAPNSPVATNTATPTLTQTPTPKPTPTPSIVLPFPDNFDRISSVWKKEGGDWNTANGTLVNRGQPGVIWLGPQNWTDIVVEVDTISQSDCDLIEILVRMQDTRNYTAIRTRGVCSFYPSAGMIPLPGIFLVKDGKEPRKLVEGPVGKKWRIEVVEDSYKACPDDKPCITAATLLEETFKSGSVGFRLQGDGAIDKLTIRPYTP